MEQTLTPAKKKIFSAIQPSGSLTSGGIEKLGGHAAGV